jgi:transcriptional regulator with XRE-family HTH domain
MAISQPMTHDFRKAIAAKMLEKGMSQAELARLTGLDGTMVRDVVNRGTTPSVTNFSKIARALGLSIQELYDGDVTLKPMILINGFTGSGDMWSSTTKGKTKSIPLEILSQDIVSIEVSSNDWQPRYNMGDVICGPKSIGANLHNLLGRDCIIETTDGGKLIKYLTRGSRKDRYTLKSLIPNQDDMLDVAIKWAAPIELVVRGGR